VFLTNILLNKNSRTRKRNVLFGESWKLRYGLGSLVFSQNVSNWVSHFTGEMRRWRKVRNLSQLSLAVAANISQRHVSWLENGKSAPSREMVVRLSDAMDIPLRDRNQFLKAAGFAALYTENKLDAPPLESVRHVLNSILKNHEPYPAFVLDRCWNIYMQNTAADSLFSAFGDANELWKAVGDEGKRNMALLTVHPQGIKSTLENWDDIALQLMRRIKKEALDSEDPALLTLYKDLAKYVELPDDLELDSCFPILTLNVRLGESVLRMCSVISSLGTSQDITVNEIRVEALYPIDEQTEQFFRSI